MFQDPRTPMVGYRFLVGIVAAGIPNPIDILFKEVSGLKMNRSIDYTNNRVSIANQKQAKTLTLKRGVFQGGSPLMLQNLVFGDAWNTYLVKNQILITTLDDNYLPSQAWLVQDAFLESWEWEGIDASRNDVLIESLSFSYRDLVAVPIPGVPV
ncbi:phage tail protein [Pseudoalteromonas luteoviolacea]|uniref:Phage tail protein n=3 Tax=Pseudoalteromonas luteoviolacea TaxID=43657 RepID=A0A023Q0K4_9GAMM|nr:MULTISPECIES: phage tail protein [Pseudoalteromonas]AHX39701.1 hypothetical protein [Pseudoalteromonas luteoviolacea]KID56760.1 hypothetical protein JF50_12685 [Pseudoalteromonas luteoviolacea]KZN45234.1 hypothetical protein N476_04285 [Pseudoalteromonas luteoviolacea H33]KZN66645.1 hypothetical protein N473_09635 [Pseudoalteromonas luteoviolacea CPMOR-1]KZN70902.1 hypothetical protein N477_05755 [Pseudoalteromonas luteoviolacea H33-S]